MRILFATAHFGFLRNFESGLRELASRGHHIQLIADRRDDVGGMRTVERLVQTHPDSFTWRFVDPPKTHQWRALGTALRLSLDYWHYLDRRYDEAPALRARAAEQVRKFAPLATVPLVRFRPSRAMLARAVRTCERVVPPSPHADQVLDELRPDVVVVTPLIYFGSQQVDYVRGARRRGLPTMLGVGSWDHLTTKGLIHEIPDVVTVWNEAQREEAARFHDVPPEMVKVTGATAYDHWFSATPSLDRQSFCARAALPADRPLLLYLCSSKFITPYEVGFVREWIEGIRHSGDSTLSGVSILIRPHPQNGRQWKDVDLSAYKNVAIWPRAGANPVDEDARNDYYHSMFYSSAVVGVNTSALIESGIVGRPVYSIRTAEFADTQEGTLHFQHLKGVNGGLLSVADSIHEHCQQLAAFLENPNNAAEKGRAFIEAFIRPHGLDVPAAGVFADVVEDLGRRARKPTGAKPSVGTGVLRRLLYPAAVAAQKATQRPVVRAQPDGEARGPRRILFIMASPEYLRFFDDTIRELAARGAQTLLAVNAQREGKQVRIEQFAAEDSRIRFVGLVPQRADMWAPIAQAVRGTMDFVRYLDPRLADAPVLRARMKRKCLPRSLQWLDRIRVVRQATVGWMLRLLGAIERAIPIAAPVAAFVEAQQPDAVLVTPLVEAASPQVDVIRAARALGVPTGACIASWDNLTNKGLLRVQPDLVTVWNEIQAGEAVELHGVARDRIVVTGAQPFDRWFEKEPSRTREEFCAMLHLDPAKPIVLFTGSSFFISGEHTELPFVRKWLQALRESAHETLRSANVLVRPHPYNADQWRDADLSDLGPATIYPRGRHNPTNAKNRNDFFDSLFHCDAVVGVNTSAMIEAAILGRSVHAVLTSDFAGTQEGTIHFRHLLPENGGFLRIGRTFETHFSQLAASLSDRRSAREETARFVSSFVRPLGVDRACVPVLADALQTLASRGPAVPARASVGSLALRAALWLPVQVLAGVDRLSNTAARKRWRLALHHQRKRSLRALREFRKRVSLRRARRAMRLGWLLGHGRSGGGPRPQ